jgi:hypothetical protein
MPSYNSISAALAAAQRKILAKVNEALKNEVTEAIQDEEIMAIVSTVYSAYGNYNTGEPNEYIRRYNEGGLVDRNNMISEVHDGVLSVYNLTPANSDYGNAGYFAGEIVINGGPYQYKKGMNTWGDFHGPRDFIADTYEGLRRSKAHVKALKEGLSQQGLDVE